MWAGRLTRSTLSSLEEFRPSAACLLGYLLHIPASLTMEGLHNMALVNLDRLSAGSDRLAPLDLWLEVENRSFVVLVYNIYLSIYLGIYP